MSQTIPDPINDDARQAAATEPSQTEPETKPETQPEAAPGADTPPVESKPEPTKAELAERALRRAFHDQRQTERKLQLVQEQLDRLQPRPDPSAPPTQEQIDRIVESRAQALVEQRDQQTRSEAWIAKGNAEYPDFTARCNALADMGAAENGAFMAAIGKLGDGHKVISELSANPAEAARILKLPPVDLALELAGLSHRIASAPPAPQKPVSQAPAPIKPLASGTSRAEANLDSLEGDAFRAAWNKRTHR